jgi:hypothetical protein
MLMSGSSPLSVGAVVSMHVRCTTCSALVGTYRTDSAAISPPGPQTGS